MEKAKLQEIAAVDFNAALHSSDSVLKSPGQRIFEDRLDP